MRLLQHWIACALLGTIAAPAADAQQEPPNSLAPGVYSIVFRLPESGINSISFWRMATERLNVGVVVEVGAQSNRSEGEASTRTESRQRVTIQPMVARYVDVDGRVAPFLFGGVFLTASQSNTTTSNTRGSVRGSATHAGVSAGGGVEWFPARQISIGGRTGVQVGATRGTEEVAAVDRASGYFLNTFTTNLLLRIYFR